MWCVLCCCVMRGDEVRVKCVEANRTAATAIVASTFSSRRFWFSVWEWFWVDCRWWRWWWLRVWFWCSWCWDCGIGWRCFFWWWYDGNSWICSCIRDRRFGRRFGFSRRFVNDVDRCWKDRLWFDWLYLWYFYRLILWKCLN